MRRFIAANRTRLRGDDYSALYDWSIERPAELWAAVWEFCGVRAVTPYEVALRDGSRMPGAQWFPGARLRFAANLLEHDANGAALVFGNERNDRIVLTWSELRDQVARVAQVLRALGVRKGDR